ncbi:hypothetical protein [Streptomyces hypolithicus]
MHVDEARRTAASVVVTSSALMVALMPTAQAAEVAPNKAVSAALKRHGNGTWTQADVALIRSIPELAAVVEDPTKPAEIL